MSGSLPCDQWHWNVSLNPVNPRPGRDKSKDSGNQVHQCCCWVALIPTCLPQLIKAGSPGADIEHMIGETLDDLPDDQRGVELESIWSEPGVLKELDELLDVSFKVNIGQVRHHVGHHLGCKLNN